MGNGNADDHVTAALRREVAAAGPGARLPSVRELMARHAAGPATVGRAVARLAREGLVEARPGRGTFVLGAPDARAAAGDVDWQAVALGGRTIDAGALRELLALPPPGAIPLSSGFLPEELQPRGALGAAMARAARRPGAWDRVAVEGLDALRGWFARELGGPGRGRDVLVCPGSQAALSAAFRALAPPGAPVVVESPTYLGALAAARAAGLRPVPVPADAGGVRPELLAEALATSGARVFYCQSSWANPHGGLLEAERRPAVREAARTAGAFVVEDEWSRDLRHERPAPPPLAADDPDGHVVYVRSLSKPAAPSLRVGALCARGPAATRLRAARIVDDFFVAGPLQEAALELVSSPAWPRHLRALSRALIVRREALAAAVRAELGPEALPAPPTGGLHLWVRLPDEVDEDEVVAAAGRAGVAVSPGRPWFPAEPSGGHLRLSFAAVEPDVGRAAVAVLGEVVRAAAR